MADIVTMGTFIGALISLFLIIIAWRMRSLPLAFISSLGWVVVAFRVYLELSDPFPMAMLLMAAFAQVILIDSKS